MQTITPFLWFDNNLEEAMAFYTGIFKDSEILNVSRGGPDGPLFMACLLYTSPSPRDRTRSRMPSSA